MRKILLIVLFMNVFNIGYSQSKKAFSLDNDVLLQNKKILKLNSDVNVTTAYQRLQKEGEIVLAAPLPSVTKKKLTASSTDIHDYVSLATYWWPNPNKKDGLPYVAIDGKVNPEVKSVKDYNNLVKLSSYIKTLGLLYYFSGDEKYIQKANFLLRTWFVNDKTKMNPNLNHAQFIKGVNKGRIEGTIETRFFVDLIDGMQLIANSDNFQEKDYSSIKGWFSAYLDWLENSEIGAKGFDLKNNIGTSYHMQRISFYLLLGKEDKLKKIQQDNLKRLLEIQFENDGKQPLEVKRSSPWNYSVANLEYWLKINQMYKNVNVNLVDYQVNGGYPLKNAFAYLSKNKTKIEDWEYKQKSKIDFKDFDKISNTYSGKSIKLMPNKNAKQKKVIMNIEDAIFILTNNNI
ncbi:alginate lyase family protein [Flavobacterium sp. LAR06]|uniref:alginate lyase family protein n=1 Tax=Flavobacterium sp. LAR06 TaxID=3064897 RepID=UPI0035C1A14F